MSDNGSLILGRRSCIQGMIVRQTYILVAFSVLELLPTSCTLEPNKCNEPTRVVIDINEVNYTIPFGVCEDESSPCTCSTGIKSLIITRAHLYSDGTERELQHKIETFDVVLPLPGMSVGTYHYSVSCEYDCIPIVYPNYCHGKSKAIELIVKVVNFEIVFCDSKPPVTEVSFYANGKEEKQKIMSGSNVTLSCSSGLNSSSNSSSLDLPVVFIFKGWNNDSITKSVECGQNHMQELNDGDWIVTRQDLPPYDCVLTIVKFGSEDVGKYLCAGLLPRDNSYYEAQSQSVIDLSIREQGSTYELLVIICVAVVAGVVLFLFLAIAVVLVCRVKRVAPVPSPYTSLTRDRSLTHNYGSTGELSFTENVSCTATLVPSEVTDSELWTNGNINITPPTLPRSPPPQRVNLEDRGDSRNNRESLEESTSKSEGSSSFGESETSGSRALTISTVESEGQEGRKYYDQHVDIDQPDGRDTPENSDAPFDINYTCEHCGKIYRQNQRLYYKHHVEHPEQRCPKYSPTKSKEEHLDTNVPPLGSKPGIPDIILSLTMVPSFGKGDNKPQKLSDCDVDFHFLTESTGSFSKSGPPSTDLSGSSSGPPSSAGEEGRQIYDGVMHVKSAIGNTPKSQFPTDPNYKCRKCGKEYRCDQRLYLKRHLNEDRCISCCSDEQRNQPD